MPIQSLAHNVAQLNVVLKHVVDEMPHDADVLCSVFFEGLNRPSQSLHFFCESRVIVFGRSVIPLRFQDILLGFDDGQ